MPPRVKITKDEIVDMAVQLVREQGADAINARTIAVLAGCSTQPIFSNFATMDALRLAVVERANALCEEYIRRETERGEVPPYKASGLAYIRFAKEEKELFKLLYMRDRANESDTTQMETNASMEELVRRNTGLSADDVKLFHLEMWAYVHGIATMFATGFLDLEWELVSRILTDAYQGLRKQYGLE